MYPQPVLPFLTVLFDLFNFNMGTVINMQMNC